MADDRSSGRKKTESSVGHENFEFATTDYDYVVPIAEFYNKPVVCSRIVYLSMRLMLLLLDIQTADISLVLQFL